ERPGRAPPRSGRGGTAGGGGRGGGPGGGGGGGGGRRAPPPPGARARPGGGVREARAVLVPSPALAHAGFLHDAEKEYVEARAVAALVAGTPVPGPGPDELAVSPTAWMRGVAEAASELRRHLLDRLREGDLERGEALLAAMDDVYDALVTVDYPDALTNGLRRTLDSLRAVLERSRGDVPTTVLQTRLQRAIEAP